MAKSKLSKDLKAVVLRKFGKYTIEHTNTGHLCVTDGWTTNWIICYGGGKWAADRHIVRQDMKMWLDKFCDRFVRE